MIELRTAIAIIRITTGSRALVGDGYVTDDEARRRREIEARSGLQILPRHGLLLLRSLALRRWQVRTRSRGSFINSPLFFSNRFSESRLDPSN